MPEGFTDYLAPITRSIAVQLKNGLFDNEDHKISQLLPKIDQVTHFSYPLQRFYRKLCECMGERIQGRGAAKKYAIYTIQNPVPSQEFIVGARAGVEAVE